MPTKFPFLITVSDKSLDETPIEAVLIITLLALRFDFSPTEIPLSPHLDKLKLTKEYFPPLTSKQSLPAS